MAGVVQSGADFALTRERAAALAGLSTRRLEYWSTTDVVRPSLIRKLSPGKTVRLYAFADLVALLVAVTLQKDGISLQHIRSVVHRLRGLDYQNPLAELRFATEGQQIYFMHHDGSWESSRRPDQLLLEKVLQLEPIRAQIRRAGQRTQDDFGRTEKRRGTMGSKPVIAGTRIPVETIQQYLRRGRTTEQILKAFPALRSADVEEIERQTAIA
jgi:uncharacterized protein (DUF433 family)